MKTECILFLRQFATLINAGISVHHACDTLETIQTKHEMRFFIYSLKKDLEAGNSLFIALSHQQKYIDSMICHLVNLAEQTGRLGAVLNHIANHYERELQRKKRLQQSLVYPCLILGTAVIVSLVLLIFVIPHFALLFSEAHLTLPLLTRIIFFISAHCFQVLVFIILICALLFLLSKYLRINKWLMTIPFLKVIIWNLFLARFIRALSLTLNEKIPLYDSLEYASKAAADDNFIPIILAIKNKLNAGISLFEALSQDDHFPYLIVQMIKVGEETGKLTTMLVKAAEYLEDQIEQTVTSISALFEPLIILLLGVVIGGVVISMYLPVFQLGSTI